MSKRAMDSGATIDRTASFNAFALRVAESGPNPATTKRFASNTQKRAQPPVKRSFFRSYINYRPLLPIAIGGYILGYMSLLTTPNTPK